MSKTINHFEKSRVYRPHRSGSLFATNVITDNVTDKNGNVHNKCEANANYARHWVNENHL